MSDPVPPDAPPWHAADTIGAAIHACHGSMAATRRTAISPPGGLVSRAARPGVAGIMRAFQIADSRVFRRLMRTALWAIGPVSDESGSGGADFPAADERGEAVPVIRRATASGLRAAASVTVPPAPLIAFPTGAAQTAALPMSRAAMPVSIPVPGEPEPAGDARPIARLAVPSTPRIGAVLAAPPEPRAVPTASTPMPVGSGLQGGERPAAPDLASAAPEPAIARANDAGIAPGGVVSPRVMRAPVMAVRRSVDGRAAEQDPAQPSASHDHSEGEGTAAVDPPLMAGAATGDAGRGAAIARTSAAEEATALVPHPQTDQDAPAVGARDTAMALSRTADLVRRSGATPLVGLARSDDGKPTMPIAASGPIAVAVPVADTEQDDEASPGQPSLERPLARVAMISADPFGIAPSPPVVARAGPSARIVTREAIVPAASSEAPAQRVARASDDSEDRDLSGHVSRARAGPDSPPGSSEGEAPAGLEDETAGSGSDKSGLPVARFLAEGLPPVRAPLATRSASPVPAVSSPRRARALLAGGDQASPTRAGAQGGATSWPASASVEVACAAPDRIVARAAAAPVLPDRVGSWSIGRLFRGLIDSLQRSEPTGAGPVVRAAEDGSRGSNAPSVGNDMPSSPALPFAGAAAQPSPSQPPFPSASFANRAIAAPARVHRHLARAGAPVDPLGVTSARVDNEGAPASSGGSPFGSVLAHRSVWDDAIAAPALPANPASERVAADRIAPAVPPTAPDPADLAESAWRLLMDRLLIEQERRGYSLWR